MQDNPYQMHITIGRKSDFDKKELAEIWEVRMKGGGVARTAYAFRVRVCEEGG